MREYAAAHEWLTIVQLPFFLQNGRSFVGSLFGGIAETQEMLDFAAEHSVAADIELIDAQDVNTAYERILASDVRYRFVVDGGSLAKPKQA